MPGRFKFLDLSGYMFSGKAVAYDLISEMDGFSMPDDRIEFDLLRVKDGIVDLENSLISWSPIRSDAAARRFLAVAKKMAKGTTLLSRLVAPGFGYAGRYPGFLERSRRFIDEITVAAWDMYWPYHLLDMTPLQILGYRLRKKLLGRQENVHYRLVSREFFQRAVRAYLYDLLSPGVNADRIHTIVINNAFEPFDPSRCLSYFDDAKVIIVDRDPRDIFVSANRPSVRFNDQGELYRRIAGAFDAQTFIKRLKTYRSHTAQTESSRVLRLQFEDLVTDYEGTLEIIYRFLGVTAAAHTRQKMHFDPVKSAANVGLWRDYDDQRSIALIAEAFGVQA